MNQEFHLLILRFLPYPWPAASLTLILGAPVNGEQLTLIALPDGRFDLRVGRLSLVSQPVDIHGTRPEFALVEITLEDSTLEFLLSGDKLLEHKAGVSRHILRSAQGNVPNEVSLSDPNASTACQIWIQKRKLKFANPSGPHADAVQKLFKTKRLI